MNVSERFLNYVTFSTASDEESGAVPSTKGQMEFAMALRDELISIGVENAVCDELGYVYASLPATEGYENVDSVGFIAHLDTSPECLGENVKPLVHRNYNGGDIELPSGLKIKKNDFSHLPSLVGRTLITASGDTLLGADDKAGVAEIMTLAERLAGGKIKHGKVGFAFTPDEEIGRGADNFDVESFGVKYAYTVDGGEEGGVEYENFNASAALVEITGFSVHPGSSKDTMVNAALVAMEFNSMLPQLETPRHTDGYEGFFHLTDMSGDVSKALLSYIIRDHDAAAFCCREKQLVHIGKILNEKYGDGTVKVSVREQYRNMREMVEPHKHIVDIAKKAAELSGVRFYVAPIRGGTDGARLSFMGLPCPNLGTGGYAFHGPYEHVTVEGMEKATEILEKIVMLYTEGGAHE